MQPVIFVCTFLASGADCSGARVGLALRSIEASTRSERVEIPLYASGVMDPLNFEWNVGFRWNVDFLDFDHVLFPFEIPGVPLDGLIVQFPERGEGGLFMSQLKVDPLVPLYTPDARGEVRLCKLVFRVKNVEDIAVDLDEEFTVIENGAEVKVATAIYACGAWRYFHPEDTNVLAGGQVYYGDAYGPFIRGDADGSGSIHQDDALAILHHLFAGEPSVACLDAADVTDDGRIDLSDAVYLLNHLYRGGPEPPAPFPDAGSDESPEGIGCE